MYTALGVGKSKKNAKRTAATAMLETLKDNNIVDDKESQTKLSKKVRIYFKVSHFKRITHDVFLF
jgi:hypothetical protein